MKPFSLSDYKTENSSQEEGVVQKAGRGKGKSSQEAEWDWHAHTKKTEELRARTEGDEQGAKSDAESVVNEEQILAEKARVSALPLVKLKFNFAGSSEHKWDRGKGTGINSPSPEGYEKAEHESGGEKMVKEKEYLGGKKMVFEYAGPIKALIGSTGEGALDNGANSTDNNLEDAKQIIIKAIEAISTIVLKKIGGKLLPAIGSNVKIDIDIKGFSRGGATASTFAAWIKSTYPENFNVNLLLIDPVDGWRTGPYGAQMENEVDVSGVHDERETKYTTGTTLVIPVASNSGVGPALEPQRIKGAQRIIIVYGSKSKHTALYKDAQGKPRYFKWNGETVKGMGLTKLPPGLYGVNSDSEVLDIEEINKGTWESKYKGLLFGDYMYGEASYVEGRKGAIDKLVMEIFERQFLKVETTSV
jgi:hypothetical protein